MSTETPAPVVLRPSQRTSHDRGGGARTTPLVCRAVGAQRFITGITELAPGAAVPFHSHDCEESVMLLEGEAVFETGGREHRLQPLDSAFIPANVVHRFRNPSATLTMKILWIYGSPDATRTLAATGETRRISAEHGG